MKKQKIVALVSILLVVTLAAALGMFLRSEYADSAETAGSAAEDQDRLGDGNQAEIGDQKTEDGSEEEPEDLAGERKNTAEAEGNQETGEALPADPSGRPKGDQNTGEDASKKQQVTLVFAGDVLFQQTVTDKYEAGGIKEVVSDSLLQEMQGADITMVNEEFPFSKGGEKHPDKQFTFRVDPVYTTMIKDMGIDLVTLANNHALDFGTQALTDTFVALDGSGIPYVGAGDNEERAMRPHYIEAGGRKFGFLAASRVIPEVSWNVENRQPGLFCTYDGTKLKEQIAQVKGQCDFVVVYVHWGVEKNNKPEEYQRSLAKEYIDAGADLVIGSHPHVLQGIEYYGGKPIVYSLGNYIFGQTTEKTALLRVTVEETGEVGLRVIPARASGWKTEEMDAPAASELYGFLQDISFSVRVDESGVVTPAAQ